MIFRVGALYGRSRIILGVLLTLYALENIVNFVYCVWISTQGERLGM